MELYSKKEKKILRGIVVGEYERHKGWRVKMTGGILWFALAASAGTQFSPGDSVQALDYVDEENKLRISHARPEQKKA